MDQFEEKKWFVFVGDHHEGPFSMAEMRTKMNDRVVTPSSFIWAEGMADWRQIKEVTAFETSGVPPAADSKAAVKAKTQASTGLDSIVSVEVDRRPLEKFEIAPDELPPPPEKTTAKDSIYTSWSIWYFSRKIIIAIVVFGGLATGYKAGFLNPVLQSPPVKQRIDSMEETIRPQLVEASKKYPFLKNVVSPIPKLKDVGTEDYEQLRAAASASMDQTGPAIAVAAGKSDPAHPVFYVVSNLPDGSTVDVYINGVRETLVGKLHAATKLTLTLTKNLATSEPVSLSGRELPLGEYQVAATEGKTQPDAVTAILQQLPALNPAYAESLPAGIKLLSRRTYFLGGRKDDSYAAKLRDYHTVVAQKARVEGENLKLIADELASLIDSTNEQFKKIRKARGPARKKAWEKFHTEWMKKRLAWLDRFKEMTPESLAEDYYYGEDYNLAKDAGGAAQILHDMQDQFFQGLLEEKGFDIQLGTATSVMQTSFLTFKTKVDKIVKDSNEQIFKDR